jgi:hypothetical protein
MTRYFRSTLIILLSVMLPSMPPVLASGNPAATPAAMDAPSESAGECSCSVRKRQQVEARLEKKASSASQQPGNADAGQLSQSTETSSVSGSD